VIGRASCCNSLNEMLTPGKCPIFVEDYLRVVIIAPVESEETMTADTKNALQPIIRLAVKSASGDSNSQFGRGVANLCLGVREFGSLNAAAKDMKMAYSKAWRIVKETEAALGVQLLNRDGAHGSTLTEEGNKLLDAYVEVDEKLQRIAEEEFAKRFG